MTLHVFHWNWNKKGNANTVERTCVNPDVFGVIVFLPKYLPTPVTHMWTFTS